MTPQPPSSELSNTPQAILDAWTALEVLSPQVFEVWRTAGLFSELDARLPPSPPRGNHDRT
jgi:hypothetical protein